MSNAKPPIIVKEVFKNLPEEIKLKHEFLNFVGTAAEGDPKPDDIDIILKDEVRNQILEELILNSIEKEIRPFIDFVWDPQGKHGPGWPIYDLYLKKRPTLELSLHKYKLQPLESIIPMQPVQDSKLNLADELLEKETFGMVGWIVEPVSFNPRITVHKRGDQVWTFNDRGEPFFVWPELKESVKRIQKPENFILDGYFDAAAKKFYAIDILFWSQTELIDVPLIERKGFLQKFPGVPAIDIWTWARCDNPDELKEFIEQQAAELYILKDSSSLYEPDQRSPSWKYLATNQDVKFSSPIYMVAVGSDERIQQLVDSGQWEKMKADTRFELMTKRSKIEPLYPFAPLKTSKKGYHLREAFSIKALENLAKEWFKAPTQVAVEKKFDGYRNQIHKKGDQVRIFTDSGHDVAPILPNLSANIKKLIAKEVILDAEVVPYRIEDKTVIPLGRRTAAQAYAGKKPVDDSTWIAHVFDLLWINGESLIDKPYKERRKLLRGLELPASDVPKSFKQHLIENDILWAVSAEQMLKYAKAKSDVTSSEGAMFKTATSKYPLSGTTPQWAKLKTSFEIDAMVVGSHPKYHEKGPKKGQPIPGSWIYVCAIGPVSLPAPSKTEQEREAYQRRIIKVPPPLKDAKDIDFAEYNSKLYSIIGNTFATDIKAGLGDILRVRVRMINRIKEHIFHWVIPAVLEKREDKTKPDPISVAAEIARETEEKIRRKSLDIIMSCRELNWFDSLPHPICGKSPSYLDPKSFQQPDLLTYPLETQSWDFVVQAHVRGLSVHCDFRAEISKQKLVGWTWILIKSILPEMLSRYTSDDELREAGAKKSKADILKKDIADMSKEVPKKILDKLAAKVDELSRAELKKIIDSRLSEVKKFLEDPENKILSEGKATEPHEWLHVNVDMEPGQVGATKEHAGRFFIIDQGQIEFGAQKSYFHEYFIHGIVFNGKFVVRQLIRAKKWEKAGRERFIWLTFRSRPDERPYTITPRAVKEGWMPPKGISALPKQLRVQIPPEHHYWTTGSKKIRDQLVEALRKREITLKPLKLKMFASPMIYEVKRFHYKGQEVVRGQARVFYAIIVHEKGKIQRFWEFEQNPLDPIPKDGILVTPQNRRDRDLLKSEEEFPPAHSLNPTQKLPLYMDTLEKGSIDLIHDSDHLYRIRFHGKQLNGIYVFLRESPRSEMWKFKKAAPPGIKEKGFISPPEPKTFITDLKNYVPSRVKDRKVLADDFRILLAWYSSKRRGKEVTHSYELIEEKVAELMQELHRRGVTFHPDEMKPYARELFEKVKHRLKKKNIELRIEEAALEMRQPRRFSMQESIIQTSAPLQVHDLGVVAIAWGLAIKEGELIAADGKPCYFPGDVIDRTWHEQVGQRIIFVHGERKGDVIGHIERVESGGGEGWIKRAVIWDREAIEILIESKEKGVIWGWSIECFPELVWDEANKRDIVKVPNWRGAAIVLTPSLEISTVEVRIERPQLDDESTLKTYMTQKYHGEGWSSSKLAEELGITKPKILDYMRKFGIPRRDLSEAQINRWRSGRFEPARIYLLGTGAEKPFPRKGCNCDQCKEAAQGGPSNRLHSSLLFRTSDQDILFDAGPDVMKQLSKVSTKPSAILITHGHPDHAFGLTNFRDEKLPVYASKETWKILKDVKFEVKRIPITMKEPFKISDVMITAFPVAHSSRAPACCFKLTHQDRTILYCPDVVEIYDKEKVFKNVGIYIGDGSSFDKPILRRPGDIGHASMKQQIKWCQDAGIPQICFTHIGHSTFTHEQLTHELQRLSQSAIPLKDGDLLEEMPKRPGIKLDDRHARLLWNGRKTIIVKTKGYTDYAKEVIAWVGDEVYGLLVLGFPEGPLPADQVKVELREQHQISDDEWNKWFSDITEVYIYRPKIIRRFQPPKPYEKKKGSQDFYEDLKYTVS